MKNESPQLRSGNSLLWVDYNEVGNDDVVEARLDNAVQFFLDSDFGLGSRVQLVDGDDHRCVGVVTMFSKESRVVTLKLDWETWDSPADRAVFEPKRVPLLSPFEPFFKTGFAGH